MTSILSVILAIIGIILLVFGVFWLLGGSIVGGIIAIIIGLVILGFVGHGARTL